MKIDYNKFKMISKKVDYSYFGRGLPFGAVRLTAIDENNKEHSIVLSRNEFKHFFDLNTYRNLFASDEQPDFRLTQKPWFEYDTFDERSRQEMEVVFD